MGAATTLNRLMGESQAKLRRSMEAARDYRGTVTGFRSDGTPLVDVDGGQRAVPCVPMVGSQVGDRVLVRNINNRAHITSNGTAPAATVRDVQEAVQVIDMGNRSWWVYHGENEDSLSFSEETEVVAVHFATSRTTRVVASFTIGHAMLLDGDVRARIYVNERQVDTLVCYEARGNAILSLNWYTDVSAGMIYVVKVTLEASATRSQIRVNDADNATLWNRLRATTAATWNELNETETTWDSFALPHTTWDMLAGHGSPWGIVEPSTAVPVIQLSPGDARGIVFGDGLLEPDTWADEIRLRDEMSFSLVEQGLTVSYEDGGPEITAQQPGGSTFSDSFGLSLVQQGLTVGFSASLSMGEPSYVVVGDDLVYTEGELVVDGDTWAATYATTVTTVLLGTDAAVLSVTRATAYVLGDVAFSASFDGGDTWLAWNGTSWAAGTMTQSEMAQATSWPSVPLKMRMQMAAGSSVADLTLEFGRSEDA